MFEELAAIEWHAVGHAYGPADDTPEHLRALLAEDNDAFEHSLDELWASICHQGSVYEASCAAVPFLIEILRHVSDNRKARLLYLLAGLAHRDFYADRDLRILNIGWWPIGSEQRHEWWSVGQFLADGNEFHAAQWTRLGHEQVAEGIPLYRNFLRQSDPIVTVPSLYLLSAFREAGAEVIEPVSALLEAPEIDIFVEASALLSLGALLPEPAPHWARYETYPSPGTHPLLRYAAAATIARYSPQLVSERIVDVLISAMVQPEQLDELYELLPWCNGSVHVEACWLLSRLAWPFSIPALTTALEQAATRWRIVDTVRVAEAILDTAFFGSWIKDRTWTMSTNDSASLGLEAMVQEMREGDRRPYPDRSYHQYGRSYVKDGSVKIACYGYVQDEADRLRERFAEEGGAWLSTEQRQALQAITHCEPLWTVQHELFKIFGLPQELHLLQRLLGPS
jgi:hypothetical protein